MGGTFGGMEILIILLVVLLFFGAKRIPELARGIGQGINEFRKASDEIKKELKEGKKEGISSSETSEEDKSTESKAN
ncbi:sec-independent protein translocase protein TatA [Fodinibius salinus]|uniref:Sec-independent protein translocase protein TatA n=1 Tax=Fodinibius salinus TaxID=860790 RepID=A0A5D3YN71_9BACT|nr:twin-arginine translocase TatA/TatE family subunit [Fodinibius salinus]TYP95142.1 sec-independent protein translocase protein TatA [Fodinibius salinus]